jgi:hypothetical protein
MSRSRYRAKLLFMFSVIALLTAISFVLPADSRVVALYDTWIYRPFQAGRNEVFAFVPFSVGDILYILAAVAVVFTIGRWVCFSVRFPSHKHVIAASLLHSVSFVGVVYIVFLLGWGGNYYKQPLSKFWKLPQSPPPDAQIISFDRWLISRINAYAPGYRQLPLKALNERAVLYYSTYTDGHGNARGLKVKPSVFGFWMQHLGIQGYYNPFTGEAQINRFLPPFMLPYVICHEMAHQIGIAAEDDANLLAYAVGTSPPDSLFRYSVYLNLWMYTHNRVREIDSVLARSLRFSLNKLSLSHLDTLRAIRRRYDSDVADYSGAIYHGYLRLHNQKDGIGSYAHVVASALAIELQRPKRKIIAVP